MYILTFQTPESSHPARHRVRLLPVEDFIGPQHHHQLVVADIGDVVRPAGDRFHDERFIAIAVDLEGLVGEQVAEAIARPAPDHARCRG